MVFLTPSFTGGGAARVLVTFANLLETERFQVAMLALDDRGPLRPLLADHVRLHTLGRARVRQALPRMIWLLRRLAPDVVVASAPQLNHPLLALRWLLPTSTRIVVREASLPSQALPFSRFSAAFRWGLRSLYPRADLVVASSQRMREELAGFGTPDSRLAVVPNPVDVDRLRSVSQPATRVTGAGRRYLAVGRLVAQKGFDRLIPLLTELGAHDQLTILGEGGERANLEALIERCGLAERVALPGFVANPWSWMAGADALVMPSHTEGMPNAALEALACGTPVIATPECGGLVEVARTAPSGAVTVVPFPRFGAALQDVAARGGPRSGASLLPPTFHRDHVKDDLEQALVGLMSVPEPLTDAGAMVSRAGWRGTRFGSRGPR